MVKIVVDTLGADAGLEPIVTGIAKALNKNIDFFPVLVGPEQQLKAILDAEGIDPARYEILHAEKYIRNQDPPHCIFGGCDDTSMAMAYGRLKNDCDAMLSAGSTGALLVGSICRLGLLPGLKFPALISALPCGGENLLNLVDCGANVECTADDLVRFAKMGDVFAKAYCGIESPRVGLMSVGREAQKGNALIQEAHKKIAALDLNFVGNVEGSDMVTDYADVIVADGFSGNLLLKCAESVGKRAMELVEQFGEGVDRQALDRIKNAIFETFDFNSRGGATFLGPRKTVVKMHGSANADTAVASVEQILRLEKANFSKAMAEMMTK